MYTATMPPAEGTSLLSSGLSFISPGAVVDIHYHHCYQVAVALQRPFDCVIGDTLLTKSKGFIINQGIPHNCNAPESPVLVHFVDASSVWGLVLKRLLNSQPFIEMDALIPTIGSKQILPGDYPLLTNDEVRIHIDAFLQQLFPVAMLRVRPVQHQRITDALKYIDDHLDRKPSLEAVASLMYLSPDRTRHFFVEQTGMPFWQYVLWKRIRGVAEAVGMGKTTAAAACIHFGFTDYPHFSRIFRRMFGVAPNGVLRDCRVII